MSMLQHSFNFKPLLQKSRRSSAMPARAEMSAADRRSLYEVLRVKQNASQVEIKTAFRTLAKLYHPDARARFMDSSIATSAEGSDFIQIHNAYATLSDPDARAEYDLDISRNSAGGYRSPGGERIYQTRRWETDQCW